jgi:hypothetical protein
MIEQVFVKKRIIHSKGGVLSAIYIKLLTGKEKNL